MGGGNAPMLPCFHRPCRILVGNGCNFSKLFDISEDWNPIKNAIFLDSPGKVSFKNSTLDQTNLINNSLNSHSETYRLCMIWLRFNFRSKSKQDIKVHIMLIPRIFLHFYFYIQPYFVKFHNLNYAFSEKFLIQKINFYVYN